MSKWWLRGAVAAGLVAAALLLRGRTERPTDPRQAVIALFDAAERGDDEAYLRLLSGSLEQSMEQSRADIGRDAFRANLIRSMSGIKGLAITGTESISAQEIRAAVELVFIDRNENQSMTLIEQSGGWAITAIERAEMVTPPVPYGTPVFEANPK
jgi:hypothetical protein